MWQLDKIVVLLVVSQAGLAAVATMLGFFYAKSFRIVWAVVSAITVILICFSWLLLSQYGYTGSLTPDNAPIYGIISLLGVAIMIISFIGLRITFRIRTTEEDS